MLLYIKNIEDKTLKYQNYSFIYMLKSLHNTVYYTYSVLYIYIHNILKKRFVNIFL